MAAIDAYSITPTIGDVTTSFMPSYTISFSPSDPLLQVTLEWARAPGHLTDYTNPLTPGVDSSPFSTTPGPLVFTPPLPGTYPVILTVTNRTTGAVLASRTIIVVIRGDDTAFTAEVRSAATLQTPMHIPREYA